MIRVQFDDPQLVTEAGDYVRDYGRSEADMFVKFIRDRWGLYDRQDVDESVEVRGDQVSATADMIDSFFGFHDWLIRNTSPVAIQFVRVWPRT